MPTDATATHAKSKIFVNRRIQKPAGAFFVIIGRPVTPEFVLSRLIYELDMG